MPFRSHETVAHIADGMRAGQLLIDATVPLAAAVARQATRMLGVWQGSAAQQAQELVPEGVPGGVGAAHRQRRDRSATSRAELDEDVLVVGDRRADKARGGAA